MEAKFQARAVTEASNEFAKDPDDPNYKPADTPRIINLVVRRSGGDAVEKSKVLDNTYLRDNSSGDERKPPNLWTRGKPTFDVGIAVQTSYI